MAKKKKEPDVTAEATKKRTADRHADRNMVSLPWFLYAGIQLSAACGNRALSLEVRDVLQRFLEEKGLWPLTADDADSVTRLITDTKTGRATPRDAQALADEIAARNKK